jgi:hypothetical protein
MKMLLRKPALLLSLLSLLWIGCEQSGSSNGEGTEVYSEDINQRAQLFSFTTGEFVSSYDLQFMAGNMTYLVAMNSAAGMKGQKVIGVEFDAAELPLQGWINDTSDYVIGDQWMDASTYNPADHSIQTNGSLFFIRTLDYEWIKLMIQSATPSQFNIKYAYQLNDSTFGSANEKTISYSDTEPAYFEFTNATTIVPEDWHLGLVTTPVYSPEVGSVFYMPSILLNYESDVQVAILEDQDFQSLTTIPDNVDWLEDNGNLRMLGYGEDNAVLVYHPEPPYNHKVIVEHPDYVYLFKVAGQYYKLQFRDYSSGIVLFEYKSL